MESLDLAEHRLAHPPLGSMAPRWPVAAVCAAIALVVCIYHIPLPGIPGDTVAGDAIHALVAGLACGALVALWPVGEDGRAEGGQRRGGGGMWAVGAGVVLCAAVTCAAGVRGGAVEAEGGWAMVSLGWLLVLAASCLGTALWEEALFRHLLPCAFAPQLRDGRGRKLVCALVCSGLFGLLHLGGLDGALAVGRFAQTALFGLAMAGIVARTGRLRTAVALHALYDCICFVVAAGFAAGEGAGGLAEMASATLLAAPASAGGILASLCVLAPLAVWACRELLNQAEAA